MTNVFPLAAAPEKPTRLELVGFNLPAQADRDRHAAGQHAAGT